MTQFSFYGELYL